MTFPREIHQKKPFGGGFRGGSAAFGVMLFFCILLFFKSPSIVTTAAARGLTLCFQSVIPVLFPFSVVSALLLSTGAGRLLIRPLAPILCPLLHLSEEGCCAVLMGIFCGAPIGAASAAAAVRGGQISSEEAERVLLLTGNASPAFLIHVVGASLLGSSARGRLLFWGLLCCQATVGLLFLLPKQKKAPAEGLKKRKPLTAPTESFGVLLVRAIRASCDAMLTVCSFAVFFSVLSGALGAVLERFSVGAGWTALLLCAAEPISGMNAAATLSDPILSMALCGFCGGWMGLSIHCQILAVCDSVTVRWSRYLAAKLLQGLLCGLLFPIAATLRNPTHGSLLFLIMLGITLLISALAQWRERRGALPPQQNNRRAYPPTIR